MPYYVALTDRRVTSTKGPCFTFTALEPIFINGLDATIPDVEAAGVLTVDQLQNILNTAPDLTEFLEKPEQEPVKEDLPNLDFASEEDIEGEMRTLRYEEDARKRAYQEAQDAEEEESAALTALAIAQEELEEAKAEKAKLEATEKSPQFDQVVFEAAVHEILKAGNHELLTLKGFPKASAIKDLTGYVVTPISITRYCKSLEK